MAETSNANQTSEEKVVGKVQRSFSFDFGASGQDVSVEEFVDELQSIKAMVEQGKIKNITFTLNVQATK